MKILFYPHAPKDFHKVKMLCDILGYEICNDGNVYNAGKYDKCIFWDYNTKSIFESELQEIRKRIGIINSCYDVSKSRVDTIFKKVFGYSSLINPVIHNGIAVEKSEHQCTRTNHLIQCPASVKKDMVYQKYINTIREDKRLYDIRVPIFDGEIPYITYKMRWERDKFKRAKAARLEKDITKELNALEIERIKEFVKIFGLQLGELDILRDTDGAIYIIDVNNICGYLIKRLPEVDEKYIMDIDIKLFKKMINETDNIS